MIFGNSEVAGQLKSTSAIRDFALAGNATLTLRSVKTGNRFTYKIRKSENGEIWFVSVLSGQDNEDDFRYLGIISRTHLPVFNNALLFRRTKKSRISEDAPSAKAFAWFFGRVFSAGSVPDNLEVWHEGQCGRCGRKLTVPESVESGFGPECVKRLSASPMQYLQ